MGGAMKLNRDFRELLESFAARDVRYLIANKSAAGRAQDLADIESLRGRDT